MSNNKFGLVPVEKTEIIDVGSSIPQNASSGDKITWGSELPKHSGEVLGIVKSVVEGKVAIARIEAETDAKVRLLDKELDKIFLESNARIEQMEKEGKVWTDKFELRKQVLTDVFHRIEMHPEWSREEKISMMDLAKELIKKD